MSRTWDAPGYLTCPRSASGRLPLLLISSNQQHCQLIIAEGLEQARPVLRLVASRPLLDGPISRASLTVQASVDKLLSVKPLLLGRPNPTSSRASQRDDGGACACGRGGPHQVRSIHIPATRPSMQCSCWHEGRPRTTRPLLFMQLAATTFLRYSAGAVPVAVVALTDRSLARACRRWPGGSSLGNGSPPRSGQAPQRESAAASQ